MNEQELQAVKERAEKATVGPWKVYQDEFSTMIGSEVIHPQLNEGLPVVTEAHYDDETIGIYINDNDSKFIVHAREDVPALIAEVERLKKALEYYADKEHYEPYCIEGEGCDVTEDEGYIARAALAGDSDAI